MMLACGHDQPEFGAPVCAHVRACRQPWLSYVRWYIGIKLDAELLCRPCADEREKGAHLAVAYVCEQCFTHATTEVCDLVGVRGAPGVLDRPEPLDATLVNSPLPTGLGAIVDIAPLDGIQRSIWLMLVEDGRLIRFDADTGDSTVVAVSTVPREPDHEPFAGRPLSPRVHVSSHGDFAAVVNDYGRNGQLIDLRSGRVALTLDGGDYHPETVPFSFAFVEINGRSLAIHRTDWNRLDVSDPATGELLTGRGPTRYARGEERPPHYLDYFHGGLTVSPRNSGVIDDGWVWHPVGIPTIWDLRRWILENPWESEDGPSKLDTCARSYYWDRAVAWIGETRIAVAGIGDDDSAMVDGARLFDIPEAGLEGDAWHEDRPVAREIAIVPGPAGSFFSDGASLFSADPTGLSRWDPATGARTGRIATFHPKRYHRGTGELAQIADGELVRWRAR
jgi:hypothetical protein